MKVNKLGLELIKSFEGCKLEQYLCSAGVSTIGWGTTLINGKAIQEGLVITQKQADDYLLIDLNKFEIGVDKLVTTILTQNQFNALVSFAYNCGLNNLKSSTLLKKINKMAEDPTIAQEFLRWNKANGKELAGLTRRRQAEQSMYFKK